MFFRIAAKDRRRGEYRRAEDRRRRRLRPTLLVLEERKLLSGIVVNNPTDTPVTGQIDLRQAIGMANMNGGIETITFDSTVFGTAQTIKLASGQLELSDTTGTETITGPSGGLTISGGNASRVFQVDEGVTASITGLTISGGRAIGNGGGVSNSGTLTMTGCTVSGNTAVYGAGTSYGGGIYNNGTLTLTGSTITANFASGYYYGSYGGGLFNSGTVTVTGSTITGNLALFTGGGGIQNDGGTATLTDTIVAGNISGTGPNDIAGTVVGHVQSDRHRRLGRAGRMGSTATSSAWPTPGWGPWAITAARPRRSPCCPVARRSTPARRPAPLPLTSAASRGSAPSTSAPSRARASRRRRSPAAPRRRRPSAPRSPPRWRWR